MIQILIYFFTYINLIHCNLYQPKKYISLKNIKNIYKKNLQINNIYINSLLDDITLLDVSLEHVFPQSYIRNIQYAKNDMHNIFLTHYFTNLHRSNYKFFDEININNQTNFTQINNNNLNIIQISQLNNNFNYKNDLFRYFIPNAESRGIISRTIAYMKLIYPILNINNIINEETLIEWNYLYPPLQKEIQRNELIYNLQGNINPFTEKNLDIEILF